MEYVVTCDGTPIGIASLAPLAGLAHADLRPLPAYSAVHEYALDASHRLREIRLWDATSGDFAEDFALTWAGGRLAITDLNGGEIAAANVMVVDATRPRHGPRVIVDVRPDMARVEAFLRRAAVDDDGRSRPAG